jgi:LEA14-like dessication related protein
VSRRRKKVLGALVVVAVILAVVGFAIYSAEQAVQRADLEKLRLSVSEVQVQEALSSSIDVNVRLVIFNPNRDTATFDRAAFDLYGNGSHLGSAEYGQKQDFPPFSAQVLVVPMSISWSGDNQALYSAIAQGNMTWELKGTAHYDTSWGTVSVPVDVTKP